MLISARPIRAERPVLPAAAPVYATPMRTDQVCAASWAPDPTIGKAETIPFLPPPPDPGLRRLAWQRAQSYRALKHTLGGDKPARLRELLRFEEGMDYRAIATLLRLAVDSPTDELAFTVNAKVGAAVEVPFFGKAELFVRGKAEFKAEMNSSGQFLLSLDARLQGGAEGKLATGSVSGELGGYSKLTYIFPDEVEAARFVQKMMSKLGLGGYPPAEGYPPIPQYHRGYIGDLKAELGPFKFSGQRKKEISTLVYPLPWLPRDERREKTVELIREDTRTTVGYGPAAATLRVRADDQQDLGNPAARGTTLRLEARLGTGVKGSKELGLSQALVKLLLGASPTTLMRLPGAAALTQGQLEKVAAERLAEGLAGKVSGSAGVQGLVDFRVFTPRRMLSEGGGVATTLFDYLGDILAGEAEQKWQFSALRSAQLIEAGGKARIPTAIGLNLFAELGLDLFNRDATTLRGSLLGARCMFYENLPATVMSSAQIAELEKTGLFTAGQADGGAFTLLLGKMRNELRHHYQDPQWREQHAEGLSQVDFLGNIDTFLQEVLHSFRGGLSKQGRDTAGLDVVSLDDIRRADGFLEGRPGPLEEHLGAFKNI